MSWVFWVLEIGSLCPFPTICSPALERLNHLGLKSPAIMEAKPGHMIPILLMSYRRKSLMETFPFQIEAKDPKDEAFLSLAFPPSFLLSFLAFSISSSLTFLTSLAIIFTREHWVARKRLHHNMSHIWEVTGHFQMCISSWFHSFNVPSQETSRIFWKYFEILLTKTVTVQSLSNHRLARPNSRAKACSPSHVLDWEIF